MKKQKDGYYHTRISVNGKNISIKARTLEQLEEKRKLAKTDPIPDMSVSDLADSWLDAIELKVKPRTYDSYKSDIKKLTEALGSYPVKNVRTYDLQNLISKYSSTPRAAHMLKQTVSRIFETAIDNEIITRNPCRGIILPKYEKPEKRALTPFEVSSISEAIKSDKLTEEERLFISILFYTGMRRGEVLALTRDSIDLSSRTISVTSNVTFSNNQGQIGTPKTKSSIRQIPIPDALYALLSDYDYDYYLFDRGGTVFSKTALRRMWESIKKKTGINISPHTFRHNYASMLYHSGVDMKEAQRLLGHSSIMVTMDIYTHFSNEISMENLAKINAFNGI